jgi:hypothetical protein
LKADKENLQKQLELVTLRLPPPRVGLWARLFGGGKKGTLKLSRRPFSFLMHLSVKEGDLVVKKLVAIIVGIVLTAMVLSAGCTSIVRNTAQSPTPSEV